MHAAKNSAASSMNHQHKPWLIVGGLQCMHHLPTWSQATCSQSSSLTKTIRQQCTHKLCLLFILATPTCISRPCAGVRQNWCWHVQQLPAPYPHSAKATAEQQQRFCRRRAHPSDQQPYVHLDQSTSEGSRSAAYASQAHRGTPNTSLLAYLLADH
ncbi:hypothetical protein COO60DRAFT_12186 [Scenedesmus sp. NREL 46B-D3]|nr:hypothetical protein COO60DRAFT_12186 [Scenedesmus sp. NREL 46B-D3]